MKRIIDYPLEDGSTLKFEVETAEVPSGWRGDQKPGQVAEKARQSFETSLEKLKPASELLIGKLRSLADAPDEIEVEFGIKLSAEAGAFIAAASAEANYKVTLKWNKK
jgi:hypothetical protein